DRARDGQSGALLLRGEAGIGKSALCAYAAEQGDGMTLLRAYGTPTESELAFSGLADALLPVLSLRDQIPDRQAAALASALAIGRTRRRCTAAAARRRSPRRWRSSSCSRLLGTRSRWSSFLHCSSRSSWQDGNPSARSCRARPHSSVPSCARSNFCPTSAGRR